MVKVDLGTNFIQAIPNIWCCVKGHLFHCYMYVSGTELTDFYNNCETIYLFFIAAEI